MEFTWMLCFGFFNLISFFNASNILQPSCSYILFSEFSIIFHGFFFFLGGGRFIFFALSQKIQCIVGGEATLVLAEHHKTKRVIKWRKPLIIFLSQAFWHGWAFRLQEEDQEKKLLKIARRIRGTLLETSCCFKALHSQVLELLLFPLWG